jgi:hypothetical protein
MASIPLFPGFCRLDIAHWPMIAAITGQFPPWSDFAFTSLFAWDTDGSCAIARLGANLVVRMKDYRRDEHFLTFLGQDAVAETVALLLAEARRQGLPAELRLVPEATAVADARLDGQFAVAADEANFDYVYAVADWARFDTPVLREHKRIMTRCRERAALAFRPLDLTDAACQSAIAGVFDRWAAQKPSLPDADRRHERAALQRIFCLAGHDRLEASGAFAGERLVGFSIWEGLPDGEWALFHFQKADRGYRGLSSWQAYELGTFLEARGYRLLNAEQDLGIASLRRFKESLGPCRMLRKFVISPRGTDTP